MTNEVSLEQKPHDLRGVTALIVGFLVLGSA
jgi:hypothetical protein